MDRRGDRVSVNLKEYEGRKPDNDGVARVGDDNCEGGPNDSGGGGNGINRFMEEVGFYSEVSTFVRTILTYLTNMRSSRVFLDCSLACGGISTVEICEPSAKLFTCIDGRMMGSKIVNNAPLKQIFNTLTIGFFHLLTSP